MIKYTIKKTTCQYAIIDDNVNYIENLSTAEFEDFLSKQTPESLQSLELKINHELFLDTLLMEIRRATIKYSSQKKKNRMARQQLLMHDIEVLDSLIQTQHNPDADALDELNDKKAALEKILDYEAEGAFVRSRVK